MSLLSVPTTILLCIVRDHLHWKDIGRLDAACCNALDRVELHNALSSNTLVFSGPVTIRSPDAFEWLLKRSMRIRLLDLGCEHWDKGGSANACRWWVTMADHLSSLTLQDDLSISILSTIARHRINLQSLCFHNFDRSEHVMAVLMLHFTLLDSLSIQGRYLEQDLIDSLPDLCPLLRHLHIHDRSDSFTITEPVLNTLHSLFMIGNGCDTNFTSITPLRELAVLNLNRNYITALVKYCPNLEYLACMECVCPATILLQLLQLPRLHTLLLGFAEFEYNESFIRKAVNTLKSLRRLHYGVTLDVNDLNKEYRKKIVERQWPSFSLPEQTVAAYTCSCLEELKVHSLSLAALQEVLNKCHNLHTLGLSTLHESNLSQYFEDLGNSNIQSFALGDITDDAMRYLHYLRDVHSLELRFAHTVTGSIGNCLTSLAEGSQSLKVLRLFAACGATALNLPKVVAGFPQLRTLRVSQDKVHEECNAALALKQALCVIRPQLRDVQLFLKKF